ncbi:MAG: FtsX-like permease family protein [Acidobacteriota bacterium]
MLPVVERTRESGLRLANGARARDVQRRFLTETLCLGLAGGIGGVVIGPAMSALSRGVPTSRWSPRSMRF